MKPATVRAWAILALVAMVASLIAVGLAIASGGDSASTNGAPTTDSMDAGFARDMAVHHAQAVEMAQTLHDRSEDPDLDLMTKDMVLTQQAQIGIMRGWLDAWSLPATQSGLTPMAWMGMDMGDQMPGMATAEQVRALQTLPLPDAEIEFLRLMIRHHEGGVIMAEHVVDADVEPPVAALARSIIASQQAEITTMNQMLAARGAI